MEEPERKRESARRRLEMLRGIHQALASWPAVSAIIWEAPDRQSAHDALRNDFGLSEVAAHFVLDLPQSRTTRQARAEVGEEVNELSRLLQDK